MMKKIRQKHRDFDADFDAGRETVDFSNGVRTHGLSQTVKLPPMTIPAWLNAQIENIARMQANSKAGVIRQLLVESFQKRATG